MDSGTPESTRETPLSCLIYYHIGISRDLHLLLGGRNCPKPVLAFSLGRFEELDLSIYTKSPKLYYSRRKAAVHPSMEDMKVRACLYCAINVHQINLEKPARVNVVKKPSRSKAIDQQPCWLMAFMSTSASWVCPHCLEICDTPAPSPKEQYPYRRYYSICIDLPGQPTCFCS